MSGKNVVRYLLVLILIIALGCGGTIAAGTYSNGFESVRTRYVLADGAVISNKSIIKTKGGVISFKLSGAGFKAVDWGDYTVSITANPQAGIKYEAGGEAYDLSDTDLTQAFAIEKQSNEFTLKGASTLEMLLKILHGKNIEITDRVKGVAPYKVMVTGADGKRVEFLLEIEEEEFKITLDPAEIIFGGGR